MRRFPFIAVQAIWGFPQTLAGCAVCLAHRGRPRFRYHGAVVTTWENAKGMSLGPFLFLNGRAPNAASIRKTRAAIRKTRAADIVELESAQEAAALFGVNAGLLVHEFGHSIQSLILGPLYLPIVGIPSLVWSNLPALARRRRSKGASYYSFGPERNANWLGERATSEPSIGQPFVD